MRLFVLLFVSLFAAGVAAAQVPQVAPLPAASPVAKPLPPCPPGVTHLAWSEFIKTPVGNMGYELTDRIKSLDGKKVRVFGYMVDREKPVPGAFWLTAHPVDVEESEAGFADLPPQAVYVTVPYAPKLLVAHTTHPLLLTGTLSVGQQTGEGDGALSVFRLTLDKPVVRRPLPKPVKPGVKRAPAKSSAAKKTR